MREFMAVVKALADESRVRLLLALADGEVCVCQLVELAELAPSTVSKHLSILKQAGLIDSRKEGRWMHYRLAGDGAPRAAREALAWALGSLEGDPTVKADRARLKEILSMDPVELCRRQCCR
ncbi:MAG: metalloregulator ArsR/SmtB family transcription factor [FCB group bacterium]|jgi:DNA-binding transcriptional ArsR family regulator|nr:metalloregulator ArsR/SmtB family transcription factor [FCB group bacterium]